MSERATGSTVKVERLTLAGVRSLGLGDAMASKPEFRAWLALALAEFGEEVERRVREQERERLHGLLERCYNAVDHDRRPALHEALVEELNACRKRAREPREGAHPEQEGR